MLKGKNVVLGVTGGIACYKSCEIVSSFKKLGANVDVILTKNATNFVQPLAFETLSQNPVTVDMFERSAEWEVGHISLAKKADVFVVAPATANIIAKLAVGIADDMLSTTVLATKAQVFLAPAMNTNMWKNQVVQQNLQVLQGRGFKVLLPTSGRLACGDEGEGKMVEPSVIVKEVEAFLQPQNDLKGKTILVTSGATIEKIDEVRYITNFSSGKMGCEIAKNANARGAEVILILGKHDCEVPKEVEIVNVETTQQMYQAVMKNLDRSDVIVKAAAPCDFKAKEISSQKIKQKDLSISFVSNIDIAFEIGKAKKDKMLVIFAAETQNLMENAKEKMLKKNADFVVANDVTQEGAGFCGDTNIVTILDRKGELTVFEKMSKADVAKNILDKVCKLFSGDRK